MKCRQCEKIIEKGYKLGVDIFCTKKCLWDFVKDEVEFSFEKVSKRIAYNDIGCLEAQQDIFEEDLNFDSKPTLR